MNEEALRISLFQFFGAAIASSVDGEAGMALIIEELTKLVSTDEELQHFDKKLMKPIIKAVHYMMTQEYNNLLEDSQKTFQNNIPLPVKAKLDADKNLIMMLDSYIKQL